MGWGSSPLILHATRNGQHFSTQRAMSRAFVGNFDQACALRVVQVADNLDIAFNAVHLAFFGFTLGTILRANFCMTQTHAAEIERPFFLIRI